MRIPASDPDQSGPNLTPLIDVVFLLLIFFLVATRFEQQERELPVRLPEVVQATAVTMTKDLVINITEDGNFHYRQRPYNKLQLLELLKQNKKKNPNRVVLIRGDGRSQWKYGVQVMGLCNKAGIENYKVAALQEK